jgi:hypothetical protein
MRGVAPSVRSLVKLLFNFTLVRDVTLNRKKKKNFHESCARAWRARSHALPTLLLDLSDASFSFTQISHPQDPHG